jgi:hypothetical protein
MMAEVGEEVEQQRVTDKKDVWTRDETHKKQKNFVSSYRDAVSE